MQFRTPIFKAVIPVFTASAMLMACGGNGDGDGGDAEPIDTIQEPINPNKSNIVNVGGNLFSIPSPVQTSLLIRKLGLDASPDITNSTENLSRYTSKAQMALNMGVYGADLGYKTVFDDAQGALNYLKAVQELADALEISNAFDQGLLERFNNSMGNEDSLLVIAGAAFRASDEYLKNNERNEVAALVIAGGWVESMHFSIESAGEKPDAALMQRIAEQRTPLKNLVGLLTSIDENGECKELIGQLSDLQSTFDELEVTYHYETPTVVVEEKTTYLNSTTEVALDQEQMKTISEKVRAIRASITA